MKNNAMAVVHLLKKGNPEGPCYQYNSSKKKCWSLC